MAGLYINGAESSGSVTGCYLVKYEACPKSIRLYFFPEKPVMAGWQI
jgi:hypothetical protein